MNNLVRIHGTGARQSAAALFCLIAVSATGCDSLRKLRASIHATESTEPDFGDAGLRVEVEPPDGIAILLDGAKVATMSPYQRQHLKAGEHKLEVRAMGYHTLALPVVLRDGETLTVPLHLRRRHEPKPAPNDPPQATARPRGPPPAPPEPTGGVGPDLDGAVAPIRLTLLLDPPGEIRLDGKATKGRNVVLSHARGPLSLAGHEFYYRIDNQGMLTLFPPSTPGATWTRDGRHLNVEAGFKLHRGTVRIKRTVPDGETRTFLLRR